MKLRIPHIICFVLLSCSAVLSVGQEDSTKTETLKVIVTKNDGAQYTGFIISDDAREILINTEEVGKLYIPKHMIQSIKPFDAHTLNKEEETELKTDTTATDTPIIEEHTIGTESFELEKPDGILENYITTKNILSENAMPIQRGESFIRFTFVGVEAGIPLTRNWSLGGFSSYWGLPVGLKTKYCFQLNRSIWLSLDAGYGTMAFGSWADRGIDDGGLIVSTSLTIGDRNKNFTVKGGYGFIHQNQQIWNWDENLQQVVLVQTVKNNDHLFFANLGGMMMLTDHSTFTFDAVLAFVDGALNISAGAALRFGRSPRKQWQLGGSLVFSDGTFIPFPLPHLSYTFVFAERKRQ